MSFKFLYNNKNVEKPNLEEYFKELNKFDNEEMLINSGLEANLELADHLIKEMEYLDTFDIGLEDNEKDKKKKISFFTIIKIIVRLVKILLRVIGVAGIHIFKLIFGKVTGYVSTARNLINKIEKYMDENNISDNDCKYKINRNDIRISESSVIDALIVINHSYKKGIYSAVDEFLFMEQYKGFIDKLITYVKKLDVVNDMKIIDNIILNKRIITKEVMDKIKLYSLDIYDVFNNKPNSPVLDKFISNNLNNFKINNFFFKVDSLNKSVVNTFLINRIIEKNNNVILKVDFLFKLNNNLKLFNELINKPDRDISKLKDVYKFVEAEMVINSKLPEPEAFTLREISEIINKIETKAKEAEDFTTKLKKLYKELRDFEDDISKLNLNNIGNTNSSLIILKYLKNNIVNLVKVSKFIIRYVGETIGMNVPNNILTEITMGKGICVGYIDPDEINNALEKEEEKIKRELK